jgi:hypothetical protein
MTIYWTWNRNRIYFTQLELAATSNSYSLRIYTIYISRWHAQSLLSLLFLHQSSDDGFQRRTSSFLWVPEQFPYLNHMNFLLTHQLILNSNLSTQSQSQNCTAIDGQSISPSWFQAHIWVPRPSLTRGQVWLVVYKFRGAHDHILLP